MRNLLANRLTQATLAASIIGAISLAPIQLDMADAATLGRVTATTSSFSSASFILHATTTVAGGITGSALVLSNSSAEQFFYIRNTGSLQINGFTLLVSGSANNSSFTYKRCDVNVSFTGANICASGITTAITLASDIATLTVPAGNNFHIQLTPSKKTTPTINISVARSQARAALTTNS